VRRDGRFFRLGVEKFHVRGVTYGPFEQEPEGRSLPDRTLVERDLAQIRGLGANCLRVYHAPPGGFLDLVHENGLKVFIDVPWPKNLHFIGNPEVSEQARRAVRAAARGCGNHPAVFALSVVNEIPPDLVRFSGRRRVERFIDELVRIARAEAPQCLVTFANFPSTEYLQPREIDFCCFNVFLHDETAFRNYLARLHHIAGELPLVIGEFGSDASQEAVPSPADLGRPNVACAGVTPAPEEGPFTAGGESTSVHRETEQAEVLARQVRAVYEEGAAGGFIFSFTDDWHVHGQPIEDWAFGLTRRDRTPRAALETVKAVYRGVPRVSEVPLPPVSVIVCTYNGAATLRACLESLQKLKYPDCEVIVVDDGSTDDTPGILRDFPEFRCIRQENMGLSQARNVGLAAAGGEIIAYTDSDCEVDEDWLYYLVASLMGSRHVGVGGPNLAPEEENWVAECVALAPGGPTHVMLDDRIAEHVPGCNMAFWGWALRQVNGFDPQFHAAGDDVDLMWRLQQEGYTIGFSPAAQVWHYRRNTVGAYLKQQRGYGEAEALLKYKHPERFNTLGASHWAGVMYGLGGAEAGQGCVMPRLCRDVVYHGLFGTGLFQSLYRRRASTAVMVPMSVEWHLLAVFVAVPGLAWWPLLAAAGMMLLLPMVLAVMAGVMDPRLPHRQLQGSPGRGAWASRLLLAYLHWRQPLTRGLARHSERLKGRVAAHRITRRERGGRLPMDPHDRRVLCYWSGEQDRLVLLERIRRHCRAAGWRFRADSGWNAWDLEIQGSRLTKVRLMTASERHDGRGFLTRVRVKGVMRRFSRVILIATVVLGSLPAVHLWPIGLLAMMIPAGWWGLGLLDLWRVRRRVVDLVDAAATEADFSPVHLSGGRGRWRRDLRG
jgi:O-antigen biosynthesis protein